MGDTLNSVGTINLGVLRPISMSRPTNVMIDMKIEKSLMSFLSWTKQQQQKKQKQYDNRQLYTYDKVRPKTWKIRLVVDMSIGNSERSWC